MSDHDQRKEAAPSGKAPEPYPAAALFPLMAGKAFKELVADIKANGLRDPIVLYEGKILDGRNRYCACVKAGVEPRFDTWKPRDGESPTRYVVSRNLHRRHLTTSQRGFIAAKLVKVLKAEAKAAHASGASKGSAELRPGKLAEQAAEDMNVSTRTVENGIKVHANGTPALRGAVDEGEVSLDRAAKLADLPPAEQDKQVAAGKPKKKGSRAGAAPKTAPPPAVPAAQPENEAQTPEPESEDLDEEPEIEGGSRSSRPARWGAALDRARAALEAMRRAKADLKSALGEWRELKEEYEGWLESVPENARASATVEKLEAIADVDLDEIESLVDEVGNADLPRGFGRD